MTANNRIEIRVYGPATDQELSVYLPWDANISDWICAFKTMLVHQTFSSQMIDEVFFDENRDMRIEDEATQAPTKKEWQEPVMALLGGSKSTAAKAESTYSNAY